MLRRGADKAEAAQIVSRSWFLLLHLVTTLDKKWTCRKIDGMVANGLLVGETTYIETMASGKPIGKMKEGAARSNEDLVWVYRSN